MSKTAIAKREETNIVPAWMKDDAGLGTEAIGAGDVEIPRVKLMQALSPELDEYDDLKQGNFWHTLAELNLGQSVKVTPIFTDQRFILWRPRSSGGGILARADDGIHWSPSNQSFNVKLKSGKEVTWTTARTVADSGLDQWGSEDPTDANSPPAATRMYNIVLTFADRPDVSPAVVTLQRSAIKVARKFLGKMKITRAPSFGLIFEMKAVKDVNAAGETYWNYAFKADGMVQDQPQYLANRELYEYFKAQGINVKDLEGAQEDEVITSVQEATPAGSPAF